MQTIPLENTCVQSIMQGQQQTHEICVPVGCFQMVSELGRGVGRAQDFAAAQADLRSHLCVRARPALVVVKT